MPNYGLVVTPTYNPMSFEDYVKPFKMYSDAYEKMADAYDQLELEAGQWEKLRDNAQDQEQWNIANKYLTDLRDAAEDLATNGLNLNTRGKVSNLRGRYSKEIVPISDAWGRREKERELQTQMRLQHPDIMFERDAFNTGLNSYIAGNPEMRSYNGALITKNVSEAASNLARELSSEISSGKNRDYWYTILGDQYYEKAIKTGLTASDVISAMRNPDGTFKPEANIFLSRIMEDAVDMTGMKDWSNWEDVADRAYNYAETGLWSAIGQTDYKNLQNRLFDTENGAGDNVPPVVPATSSTVIRGQVGKPKDANKVRESLQEARGRVMQPWEHKNYKDLFVFSEDSPLKPSFNSPLEAETWANLVTETVKEAQRKYSDARKAAANSPDPVKKKIPEELLKVTIGDKEINLSQADALVKDAEALKKRIDKYKELVGPYFRTLQIDDNNFATDEQLALISQIQQNAGVRQSVVHSIDSTDASDRKVKEDKYDQIVKGVRNFDKENINSRGLYKINKKTGSLKKITDEEEYDKITNPKTGSLVYSTEYGLVIQSGENLYLPKGETGTDSFNTSNKAILQALYFDDSLYSLDSNKVKNKTITSQLGNLNFDFENSQYHPDESTVVYQDENVTIYEGLGKGNYVERVVADNVTGNVITVISVTEAADPSGFLADGEFQRSINRWIRQGKALTTIANDKL